jgi:hypothetical protein
MGILDEKAPVIFHQRTLPKFGLRYTMEKQIPQGATEPDVK